MRPLIDLYRPAVRILGHDPASPQADLMIDEHFRAHTGQLGESLVQRVDIEPDERAPTRHASQAPFPRRSQ